MKNDQNFPHIRYEKGKSFRQWGQSHGEEFRQGIKELAVIRKELMLAKSPHLQDELSRLVDEQWAATEKFCPDMCEEMSGIMEGSHLSKEAIVILNNYTDFRDIELPSEGCSTIHLQREDKAYAGQTWDMHGSAKNYLCALEVPATDEWPSQVVLSLVGCLGLMAFNHHRCMIGVNNINTRNARGGLIWPALVRRVAKENTLENMRETLVNAPVTSGHNYIISTSHGGEHWEITPHIQEQIHHTTVGKTDSHFHTNHCLGPEVKATEVTTSLSSTTHVRYELLEKKVGDAQSFEDLTRLLMDHENHPKSICSHFESNAQDPSFTCGGGTCDFQTGEYYLWRGCPVYDENFRAYTFKAEGDGFTLVKGPDQHHPLK